MKFPLSYPFFLIQDVVTKLPILYLEKYNKTRTNHSFIRSTCLTRNTEPIFSHSFTSFSNRKWPSDLQKYVIIGKPSTLFGMFNFYHVEWYDISCSFAGVSLGIAGILVSSMIFDITKRCRFCKQGKEINLKVDKFLSTMDRYLQKDITTRK